MEFKYLLVWWKHFSINILLFQSVLRAGCHHRHDTQWQNCDSSLQQVQNCHHKSVFSLRVKTVISSGLEETHRPVHASSDRISNKLRLLNSCHPSGIQIIFVIAVCSPDAVLHVVIRFTAMFLDSHVGRLCFQILSTLLPLRLLSFRAHVYRREQHF